MTHGRNCKKGVHSPYPLEVPGKIIPGAGQIAMIILQFGAPLITINVAMQNTANQCGQNCRAYSPMAQYFIAGALLGV